MRRMCIFFFLSLYAFTPKGALGYEAGMCIITIFSFFVYAKVVKGFFWRFLIFLRGGGGVYEQVILSYCRS